jgi:hypothetical protein
MAMNQLPSGAHSVRMLYHCELPSFQTLIREVAGSDLGRVL